MAIFQKTLAGTCEITTGTFTPTTAMPMFTGENNSIVLSVAFQSGGADYDIPLDVTVRAYLYYGARPAMTPPVLMDVADNVASCALPDTFMPLSGSPQVVVRMVGASSEVVVACAFAINVKAVTTDNMVYLSPPNPDTITYIGRSPYIGENGNWYTFSNTMYAYVDTEIAAVGNYYVFAKWSTTEPTQDSDMQDTPADWIGWYTGPALTAPTHYTDYVWFDQKGEDGDPGTPGDDGIGIASITKTSTVGLVDTYTITYTDEATSTFDVTNGSDGDDGVGIVSIIKTGTVGLVDTYTITYTDATTSTFDVTNGEDGAPGSPGVGVPSGGTSTQVLVKTSATDYATAWGNAILQYATMPTAAVGLVGQIAQFTGTTGAYTNGYTYICQSDGGAGYEWAEHTTGDYAASVQGIPTGGTAGQALVKSSATDYATEWGNTQLQYSTMPTATIGNLGWTVTFTGTTDETYTHGHVYECVSSGGGSPIYSWEEVGTYGHYHRRTVGIRGDSIVYGQSGAATRSDNPWPSVFSGYVCCTVDALGSSGSCMAVSTLASSEINALTMQATVAALDVSDMDTLIIAFGTNDYGYQVPLGQITDVAADATTVSTFYGAMNYIVDALYTKKPTLEIIFMTPLYAADNVPSNPLRRVDYNNAIKNICASYNMPCIDMLSTLGINAGNVADYYWDNLHPNDNTYIMIGKYVADAYPYQYSNPAKHTIQLTANSGYSVAAVTACKAGNVAQVNGYLQTDANTPITLAANTILEVGLVPDLIKPVFATQTPPVLKDAFTNGNVNAAVYIDTTGKLNIYSGSTAIYAGVSFTLVYICGV